MLLYKYIYIFLFIILLNVIEIFQIEKSNLYLMKILINRMLKWFSKQSL